MKLDDLLKKTSEINKMEKVVISKNIGEKMEKSMRKIEKSASRVEKSTSKMLDKGVTKMAQVGTKVEKASSKSSSFFRAKSTKRSKEVETDTIQIPIITQDDVNDLIHLIDIVKHSNVKRFDEPNGPDQDKVSLGEETLRPEKSMGLCSNKVSFLTNDSQHISKTPSNSPLKRSEGVERLFKELQVTHPDSVSELDASKNELERWMQLNKSQNLKVNDKIFVKLNSVLSQMAMSSQSKILSSPRHQEGKHRQEDIQLELFEELFANSTELNLSNLDRFMDAEEDESDFELENGRL